MPLSLFTNHSRTRYFKVFQTKIFRSNLFWTHEFFPFETRLRSTRQSVNAQMIFNVVDTYILHCVHSTARRTRCDPFTLWIWFSLKFSRSEVKIETIASAHCIVLEISDCTAWAVERSSHRQRNIFASISEIQIKTHIVNCQMFFTFYGLHEFTHTGGLECNRLNMWELDENRMHRLNLLPESTVSTL